MTLNLWIRSVNVGLHSFRNGYQSMERKVRRDGLLQMSQSSVLKNYSSCPSIENQLEEIFKFQNTNMSNWIVESKVRNLCCTYKTMSAEDKRKFLWTLALQYSVNHQEICCLAKEITNTKAVDRLSLRERALKNALTPQYHWLFVLMGRLEHGVKFLVDLRTDGLDLSSRSMDTGKAVAIQKLNLTLHDLLLLWFSVGFLHLERITWQSSCEMLQKISDYEAIHPVRNWLDLKRRVGSYRRCFVFTHPSMPREPLVVLHTALCDVIPETVKGIEESQMRIAAKANTSSELENVCEIKTAIFYSIVATQKGLKGIELGNYLIKEVAKKLTREFSTIDQLSTLSPVPKFRQWFLEGVRKNPLNFFTKDEIEGIKALLNFQDLALDLKKLLNNSIWTNDDQICNALKQPLMRACAWYLYREKHRNYTLNTVANFHLRNGAMMWRINWLADPTPRGVENSCGIMVNYKYSLHETEENSRNYIENYRIKTSENIISLSNEAQELKV